MSGDATSVLLQPGQRIKPNVSDVLAKQLIQQYYGFRLLTKIKQLNSYDDINFYIEAANSNGRAGKYIFKVLNSLDSLKTGHVEAEHACMLFLVEKGVNCPIPEKNLAGDTFSVVSIPSLASADIQNNHLSANTSTSANHVIRLLKFVEGKLLVDVPITENLLHDTGSYISRVDNYLKGFSHAALKNHDSMWMLSSVPNLLQFAYVFQDQPAKLKLVQEVVSAFKNRVESSYGKLEKVKGIIHGDLNEQNMLVQEAVPGSKKFGIYGIIDFGDLQERYYIFELAISLTYLMLQCLGTDIDPIQGSAILLSGYSKHRTIPKLELDLLRVCVSGRLCQSLVMGAYTYSLDPGNEYLLTTAQTGWKLLSRIWNDTTDDQLKSIWKL